MRTFDYYCFVACDESIVMNSFFKKQIKLSEKIANILNLDLRNKNIDKIVKHFLLRRQISLLKKSDFNTPEEFVEICNHLKDYVDEVGELIDYHDGLHVVGNYTFLGMYKREIEEAVKRGKFLRYDPKEGDFFNIYGCKVNISGKSIFPRTHVIQVVEKIEQMGGVGINTSLELEMLQKWFLYIEVDRDMHLTTLREIIENPAFLENYTMDSKVFIKTVKKKFSDVCRIIQDSEHSGNLLFEELNETDNFYASIDNVDLDEQIIISRPVRPTKDKYGLREWRVFVIDNEIQSISRRDAIKSIEIEDQILEFANRKIQQNTGKIPANYVMDIMEYIDEFGNLKLDIVELNPMMNAWAFFDNSIVYGNIAFDSMDDLIDLELMQIRSTMQFLAGSLNQKRKI